MTVEDDLHPERMRTDAVRVGKACRELKVQVLSLGSREFGCLDLVVLALAAQIGPSSSAPPLSSWTQPSPDPIRSPCLGFLSFELFKFSVHVVVSR